MTDSTDDSTHSDASFDQLRAADPARDAEPDLAALEAKVRSRLSPAADVVSSSDDLADRRERKSRNHRPWLGWAAVAAAAAVLVGGGGFALGRGTDRAPGSANGAISASSGEIDQRQADRGAREQASEMYWPASAGRIVFTSANGLATAPGSAEAWTLDARAVFSKETAAQLASALGVKGSARLIRGTWVVGEEAVSSAAVRLEPDGLASFNFYNPTYEMRCKEVMPPDLPRTQEEEEGDTPVDQGSGSQGSANQGCDPAASGGDAPSRAEALKKTKALLADIGVDPDAFEYDVPEQQGSAITAVTAYSVVDGQRSGVIWNASWAGKGLQSINGSLAPPRSLGDYDVVSEQEALARLNDPRFGAGGSFGPFAAEVSRGPGHPPAGTVTSSDDSVASSDEAGARTVPAPAKPGSAIAWPVEKVTLTKARLVIALQHTPDGAALLIPTYEFSSTDGRTWSVVAVADKHLDFTPPQ